MPEAGGRAALVVICVGELALPLISYSIPESGPYAMPGPYSRTATESVGGGDLTLRTWKQKNWPCPLLITERGELTRTMQVSLTLVVRATGNWTCWPTLQQPRPRAKVMCWPTPHLPSDKACENNGLKKSLNNFCDWHINFTWDMCLLIFLMAHSSQDSQWFAENYTCWEEQM